MPAVRPEHGPTLPALVRARFGVPERVTLAAAAVLVLAAVALALGFRPGDPARQLVHRGTPVFNVLYDPDAVRAAAPGPGELVRLEARRRRAQAAFAVRPLALPDGPGAPTGRLALRAERHVDELRRRHPDLDLRRLGKARVNDAVGFEVVYQLGPRGRRTHVRDVLVVAEDPRVPGTALLRVTQTVRGRLGPGRRAAALPVQAAQGSFRFGTEPDER